MASGGGDSTTTTVEYPDWLTPYIAGGDGVEGLLPAAYDMFMEGPPDMYAGQTYANLTPEQRTSQDLALNYATNDFWNMYNPMMSAFNQGMMGINPMDASPYMDMYRANAYNPYASMAATQNFNPYTASVFGVGDHQNPFIGGLLGVSGNQNPYASAVYGASQTMNPYAGAVAAMGGAQNPYLANLEGMFGTEANPYLDRMFQQGAGQLTDAFQQAMSGVRDEALLSGQQIGAGQSTYMGGADVLSQNLGEALTDLSTNIYGGAYETDMNRALQAMTSAGQLGETGLQRALQAMTQAGGFTQADLARQLQGTGMAADVYGRDMDRQLQTLIAGGQLQGDDLNRMLSAYTSAADISGQDMARNLQGIVEAGGMYSADIDRMLSAAGIDLAGEELSADQQTKLMSLAPQMIQMGLTPSQIYGQVGSELQAYDQRAIDEAIQRYYYPYQSQMDNLGAFSSMITGFNPGGTTTTTAPNNYNPWAQGIGNAMTGYGMGMMMGVNPWMMAGGMALPAIWGY